MMRPARRSSKPPTANLDLLTLPQLEDLLAKNERTLRNPSLFASSSTAPPDPIATRLMNNNDLIRRRIEALSLSQMTNHLSTVGLTENEDNSMNDNEDTKDEKRREEELRRMLDRRGSESTHGGLKILSPEQVSQAAQHARSHPTRSSNGLLSSQPEITRGNLKDELSYVERAARMQSFLNYGPSESDLEWEQDSEDEDDWLNDDDGEDEDEDINDGVPILKPILTPTLPPNGSPNPTTSTTTINTTTQDADGDQTMSDPNLDVSPHLDEKIEIPMDVLGGLIKVDVERTRGVGGLSVGR